LVRLERDAAGHARIVEGGAHAKRERVVAARTAGHRPNFPVFVLVLEAAIALVGYVLRVKRG